MDNSKTLKKSAGGNYLLDFVKKSSCKQQNEKMEIMKNILITGATGNVGMAVIKGLSKLTHTFEIYAGVFDLEKDKPKLQDYKLNTMRFDFTDAATYKPALAQCDILFLLRPPQLSEVEKYFKPLINLSNSCGVKHIVFLSVQGVEKSTIIPHHKIEKLIVESDIPYTFLRPAYFMQNFTSTLHNDLVKNKSIFLPSGNAKFTLVDVTDVGEIAAKILTESKDHLNKSYELTCNEKLTFAEMAEKLSEALKVKINYESPNLIKFYLAKRKEKIPAMLILVMIILHYLPRFQKEPQITNCVKELLYKEPNSFEQFIQVNLNKLKE